MSYPLDLTATGLAPAPREVMDIYRAAFAQRMAEGSLRPMVLPYNLYPAYVLIAYMCIPHTKPRYGPFIYAARWPLLAWMIRFYLKTIRETSSTDMATAFGAGLVAAWGIAWSCTWLVFKAPQWDAKRVERRKVRKDKWQENKSIDNANGGAEGNVDQEGLRRRKHSERQPSAEFVEQDKELNGSAGKIGNGKAGETETEYYWQPYPDDFHDRLDWVLDLLMNFRGPGWNWAVPPLPALPPFVKRKLGEPVDEKSKRDVSSAGIRRFSTRRQLFLRRVPEFIAGYLMLDILKVLMMKDPYFIFGPNSYALPPHLASLSPLTLTMYRQALALTGILTALETIFLIAPVVGCVLLGPKYLGLRGEAWQYTTTFGSFKPIFEKGLSGLWGGWWHQTFRFAFAAPINYLISKKYILPKSETTTFLGLLFAFGISGALHSGGSLTQFPHTHPWHAPIFFMLQALGIIIQSKLCSLLHPYITRVPKPLRQAGNFLYAFGWLSCTSSWLVDDFSRGGIWLFDPIAISPLRGLGYGQKGDGWWCWEHVGVGWYTGKHWWQSGIALYM